MGSVLSTTHQRWHFPLYHSQLRLVLNLATAENGRLSWPSWLVNSEMLSSQKMVTHPSTNWAWCKVTSLMRQTMLPLCQNANHFAANLLPALWPGAIAHKVTPDLTNLTQYLGLSACTTCSLSNSYSMSCISHVSSTHNYFQDARISPL